MNRTATPRANKHINRSRILETSTRGGTRTRIPTKIKGAATKSRRAMVNGSKGGKTTKRIKFGRRNILGENIRLKYVCQSKLLVGNIHNGGWHNLGA